MLNLSLTKVTAGIRCTSTLLGSIRHHHSLGRQVGSVFSGNLIHDVPVNAGRAGSNGMFIDEGSSQILIENNTIYNIAKSPIRFHKATTNTIRNNRLVNRPGVPTFRYNATRPGSMKYENNKRIEAKTWTPPKDDPAAHAGPKSKNAK